MTITRRWGTIASVDLGTMVNPLAQEIATLFERMETKADQINVSDLQFILPLLKGFAINTAKEDFMTVVTTLDLCYVNIHDSLNCAEQLEGYLMIDKGWLGKHDYAMRELKLKK